MTSPPADLPVAARQRGRRWLPLLVVPAILLVDQAVKAIVLATLPHGRPLEVVGDLLRFTLIHNPAIAFSIGHGLPAELRRTLFLILPLLVVVVIFIYYLRTTELSQPQRWLVACLIGGGISNYGDRLFRPAGVVDFIDVKFYGLFGLARFPTFNLADSSVVVAGILLLLTFLVDELAAKRSEPGSRPE